MTGSTLVARVCDELGLRTGLDPAAVRRALRIALRRAGLQAGAVGVDPMLVLLRRVLPGELRSCGVGDPDGVCCAIERVVRGIEAEPVEDAAAVFERFGPH